MRGDSEKSLDNSQLSTAHNIRDSCNSAEDECSVIDVM